MLHLVGFVLFLLALGVVALSQSASAQTGEEGTSAEPNLVEEPGPSSEAALEEPALQLKLDAAGVDATPSPLRTVDRYTLEEMELRVRRARIGLLSTTGVAVVGAALFGAGAARARSSQDLDALSEGRLLISGISLMIGGAVGMIASGIVLGFSKGELRRLEEARHEGPHRVQWDLAQSRLAF
jgi:hypothetical protein